MRILPDWEFIESDKYPIDLDENRHAEIYILGELKKTISEIEREYNFETEFAIYYQPYINNNNPDLIIHRPGYGALILEVKNIDLSRYRTTQDGRWQVKSNKDTSWHSFKSPFAQVQTYKKLLLNYYLESAAEMVTKHEKLYSYLSTAVYFHGVDRNSVSSFNPQTYDHFVTESEVRGGNTCLKELLKLAHLTERSYLDCKEMDCELERVLQPPDFVLNWNELIDFNHKDFENVIQSRPGNQKVRGFAGTGKTTLLAKRAVDAQLRTGQRVLIVCFNITMVNFLHDKISFFRQNAPWDQFEIIHFHLFIVQKMNRLEIAEYFDDSDLQQASDHLKIDILYQVIIPEREKYAAIFVDEVQDFKYEWLKVLQLFLKANGEFVLAGDENQNIYKQTMDKDHLPRTPVPGNWNLLRKQRRSETQITQMAIDFFHEFLAIRYPEIDVDLQRSLVDEISKFAYCNSSFDYHHYKTILKRLNSPDQDVTILSNSISTLRQIEYDLRVHQGLETSTMFETKETWERLRAKYSDDDTFRRSIKEIRKSKKFNFRLGNSFKLATIHSFKGASQSTIILILCSRQDDAGESESSELSSELMYTAITRPKKNLIIYDQTESYKGFFEKY